MKGWIKLHRTLADWQWYNDIPATRLLIHLLIHVNYEQKKWMGIEINPGSMILSWETLSKSSGLSVRQCRTAMKKLENSGEVTRSVTAKFQLVTLVKWEELQDNDSQATAYMTEESQKNDSQATTTKEDKEYKERKEDNNTKPLNDFLKENRKPAQKTFMFKNSIYTDYDEVVKWFKAHPSIAKRFSGVNVRFYIEAVGDWNDKQKNPTLRSNVGWVKTIKQFMQSDLLDNKLKMVILKKKTTDYNPGNY